LRQEALQACAPLVDALAATDGERRVGVVSERVGEAIKPLISARYPDWNARLPDLDALTLAAANALTLSEFLAELALDPPASSADYAQPPHLEEDYLTLSTVHSAKGLEWDSVHVIAVSDGNFPSDMALTTPEGLEEERRLFYVAVTRARRTLTIYAPLRYYHRPAGNDDAHGYGKKSRFLTDEAQRLCEQLNLHLTTTPQPRERDGGDAIKVDVDLGRLWR
jgi:DNA helicase-2/ATP-dependent DNA helicase PcrA